MMHLIHTAYAVACGITFAGIAMSSKLMTPGIPALVKVFLRFFIGGLCLVPFLSRAEFSKVTRRHVAIFAAMGFVGVCMFNLLFFSALNYIDPMTSALLLSAQPIMTLVASAVLFNHRVSKSALVGFLLALSGVALVITKGRMSCDMFSGSFGELLMLAAVASQVTYTLILRTVGAHFSAPFITFALAASGLIWLLPLVLQSSPLAVVAAFSSVDWLCMGYIGSAGTALGVVLFSLAVKTWGQHWGA
jgi:drug/metabolite transporter (DMT)-like permease